MSQGYLSFVLHAHLPFVRHSEHERFLEENWFFEAVTESYIPLLQVVEGWRRDAIPARVAMTVTPTLCAMLEDPLLQRRLQRYMRELQEFVEKETHRTLWQPEFRELALFYQERLQQAYHYCERWQWNLASALADNQRAGSLEILTSAATHALLPLLLDDPVCLRAQLLVARDHYVKTFGCVPEGIWLPECGFAPGLESYLEEAGLRWFIVDTHGLLNARPRPVQGVFAPLLTPAGVAAFGRDMQSARQVWSRHGGYPGDPRYRDFFRDAGYDLDQEYLRPHLPVPEKRSFTGIKYHRIGGPGEVYRREPALEAVEQHAEHFLAARMEQVRRARPLMDKPPIVVAPYDAELFGHWWYEGPEFLDRVARKACEHTELQLISPGDYLERHSRLQVATPSASSWGEGGYWKMWLNENTEWLYPHLRAAQGRMRELANVCPNPSPLEARALNQAGRELLLAQASDWPFILRTATSPTYARSRVETHLTRFNTLFEELKQDRVNGQVLAAVEEMDNLFPAIDYRYWQPTRAL